MSDVLIPTAEIRRLADSVQAGECITFPNGLVVDKRIAFGPAAAPLGGGISPTYVPGPSIGNGWQCPSCGIWTQSGTAHICYRYDTHRPATA